MIQIIKGTFGYYNGRKVIPITEADGPQKFDDELEARLVKEGVAKYIGELGETAEQPAPAPGDARRPTSSLPSRPPRPSSLMTVPTTRSPLRSAPPIPSDGLQLQGDGRG